jgi:glycine betaine/choline ABC-type transport system substrate-binding protein
MIWRNGWGRAVAALAAACVISVAASACGGSDNGDVTLTIGSRATPEEEVLGQIYAQALRQVGYEVKDQFGLENEFREVPLKMVRSGRISGYPEHVGAALQQLFAVEQEDLPNDPQEAYEMAKAKLGKDDLTAFPPTPYSLNTPVVVLRKTAQERDLKTVSDLKGEAEEMSVLGPNGCFFSYDCLGGLERYYRTSFEAGGYAASKRLIEGRFRFLERGEYDALMPYSTEGRLAEKKFVILEDDKHVFPAGNTIFVTSQEVVEEAGPDFEATILAAQEGLTLPVMQRLDAEVELEGKDPAEVAAGYLRRSGLAVE